MAKKAKYTQPESRELSIADLRTAITKIGRRIDDFKKFDVNTITERFDAKTLALKDKINSSLADIFGYDTVEYQKYNIWSLEDLPNVIGREYPLQEVKQATQKGIDDGIIKLESLKEILQEKFDDIPKEESAFYAEPIKNTVTVTNREVFIVHGHDEAAKLAVDSFLKKLDLIPIILHEQSNKGRTIIEKFEEHSDVGFAVVLMTPDDVGASTGDKENPKPRARQNVILELGFFLGKLGRKHVCSLYKEGVEIPSDYKGVLFIPMDKNDGWKLSLAREIKAVGMKIDMNKL
jgi:predicted nucleotide-binding protein